jgi:L,D-peptidoglycan transpeptidase YkuD (ErfK/YbiS/YcfS/YnhG family)
VKDKGSAIFLHPARADFAATEGCVALARDGLLHVLSEAAAGDVVRVIAP